VIKTKLSFSFEEKEGRKRCREKGWSQKIIRRRTRLREKSKRKSHNFFLAISLFP
jgi:hypothetical protein